MSKLNKIIAGLGVVAGLGVAVAPVATFASSTANIGTDNIRIVVDSSCTLKTTAGAAWSQATNYYYAGLVPGQYATLGADEAGDSNEHDGSNNVAAVKIMCNAGGSYEIKGVGTALVGTGTADEDNFALASGNVTEAGSVYGWGAKFSATSPLTINTTYAASDNFKGLPDSAQTLASTNGTATAAGETFTITGYAAKAKTNQKAGEYSGTATYTLVFGAE